MQPVHVDVLVVGGGPAGMVAACLLSRTGLHTLVIERNPDFDREFRGEILQPRFHRALRDVGLHDHLAAFPHEEIDQAHIYFEGKRVGGFRLDRLDPGSGTTWWMTQPALLAALQDYAQQQPAFTLWFGAALRQLGGHSAIVERDNELITVEAKVVIGADGRYSSVRRLGGFELEYEITDLDVVWFLLPRPSHYDHVFSFFLTQRHNYLILPKHPDQLQCGIVVAPGEFVSMRHDLAKVREELKRAHPLFAGFAEGLKDWSPFRPLKGEIALAKTWAREGVVLIGDAAHTCSPAGGIGVSVAVETAIVAAQVVLGCFARGGFSADQLGLVQARREPEIRTVHALQRRIARNFLRTNRMTRLALPHVLRFISHTGLFYPFARQLLTQRAPVVFNGR